MLDWLEIARNQAEERFRSIPLPGAKDENFRNSPVADLHFGTEPAALAEIEALPAELTRQDAEEAALVVCEDEDCETRGELGTGIFTGLLQAAMRGSEPVRATLRELSSFRDDKFAQLTAARWTSGAFLHVPAGMTLAKPLRIAQATRRSEGHHRSLILLEEGAEATVYLENWSAEGEVSVGDLLEARLARGAKLHLVALQHYGSGTRAIQRQRFELSEGAELDLTPVHFGGRSLQLRQEVILAGTGAKFRAEAAATGNREQQFDFWLDVKHIGAKTESEMNYWFVMDERARAAFNGLIHIEKGAVDAAAAQKSKSLLLGPKASVHSVPKLIIQHDAVKCSHGASISTVNPEQVHYLQSRGIPRLEAERMIVRGFTEHVLARVPTESFAARAAAALDAKERGKLQ